MDEQGDAIPNPVDDAQPAHQEAVEGSAPETVNLLDTLDEETQKKYGEDVCRRTDVDLKSSADFRKRRANIVKLYLGQMPSPGDDQMNYA